MGRVDVFTRREYAVLATPARTFEEDPVQEPVPQVRCISDPEAEVLWKLEVGVSMVGTPYIRRQR